MSIRRQIDDGTLTLSKLSALITSNEVISKEWEIRLKWGFKMGKLFGKVMDGPFIVHEIFYEGDYTHVLLARMHYDFSVALQSLIDTKKRDIRLASLSRNKKGEGDGRTMGERAEDTRNNNKNNL